MRYARGGEWTEETQAEWERLYAVYQDGDRDTIFALLFEEKLALELHAEQDKKAIESAMNKIDMQQAEIEDLLRILADWVWVSEHGGTKGHLVKRAKSALAHHGEYVDMGERYEDGSPKPAHERWPSGAPT